MATARMNRLFSSDGRVFNVAIDHGLFNEPSFLVGIEEMKRAIHTLVDASPDAVQLSMGQAHILQEVRARHKPALVLRVDVANVYGQALPSVLYSHLVDDAVEHALLHDAACVCVNLFQIPDHPEVHAQCVANISRLIARARPYGLPVMVEPLVMRANEHSGGYQVDGDSDKIVTLVRQAVELGADVIKADPTDDLEQYGRVVTVAGRVPVLVRGGGRAGDLEILQRTERLMAQGVRGIVYGRNVIQHENPPAMTRALMAIVHEDATSSRAMEILQVGST